MAADGRSSRTQRASPSSCGGSRPAASSLRPGSARSWLRPGVGCGSHKLQSELPIPAQGWVAVGSSFSGSRTTPLCLPAPRRGWSCGAGPLNPGRTEGRLAGAGEQAQRAVASGGGGGAPSTARGGGGTLVRCGGVWAGGRDSCREATRARTRTFTHTHTHTQALTPPPAALLPQNLQSPPLEQ